MADNSAPTARPEVPLEHSTPPRAPGQRPVPGTSGFAPLLRRSPRLSPAAKQLLAGLPQRQQIVEYHEEVSRGRKRSHDEIVAGRGPAPPGFPLGPWASHTEAENRISEHFRPGFAVKLHGFRGGSARSGAKSYLLCHLGKKATLATGPIRTRGSILTNCKWKVSIEESEQGWVISKFDCLDHNHELGGSNAEALAHAAMRSIPDDMASFGTLLKLGGMSPAEILNLFNEVAHQKGREVTWNYDDIYNMYKVSAEDRLLDASRFCDWLQEMDNHGLPSFVDLNQYGQLNAAAFTVPGALEWWAVNQDSISVHYDTTFSTNRSGMKLGLVTAVDGDGHTRILFASLVAHQNQQSFKWVLQKLLEVFRILPKVIFTDSDPALAIAIAEVLIGAAHLLCTWHLSLNLATNVKAAAGSNWSTVSKKFWQICKETEITSRETFNEEFQQLINVIPVPPVDNDERMATYRKAVEWMQKLYDKRERWAARWTWAHHSAGVQSTQRAESIHSAVKRHTSASGLLTQLGEKLLRYANGAEIKSETAKARCLLLAATRSFGNQAGHMAAVQSLDGSISEHAMDIVKAQQAQAMAYNVVDGPTLPSGVRTFVIERSSAGPQLPAIEDERNQEDYALPRTSTSASRVRHTTLHGCTCQFPTCWGLPCRHMLRLLLHLQVAEVPHGVVRSRWMIHDASYVTHKKRELLRTAPMSILPRGSSSNMRKMTRAERYAFLTSECKSLSEVASAAEEAGDILVKHLDLARAEIAQLQLPVDEGMNTHSFNPRLFPNGVLNPGLPTPHGRPQSKRIESSGKSAKPKAKKSKT